MRRLRNLRFPALAVLAAALALAGAGYLASPARAIFDDSDGDGVLDLAETIAGSDPGDAASIPEDTGVEFFFGSAYCRDGRDNDGDGLTDNLDTGCRDTDRDVVSDPMETLLGSNPNDGTSFPEDARLDTVLAYYGISIYACADGVENDHDGALDGADSGCVALGADGDGFDDATEKRYGSNPSDPNSVPEHERVNPGSCSDGIDNDGDEMTDGADPACAVPGNDNRASAIAITSLPYATGPAVMKNATVEAGEPRASCVIGGGSASLWYRYTANADATLVADTNGSNFSTTTAVYHDAAGHLDEVACTAYTPGGRAIFDVEAGETYYFQVGGFPFAEGLPQLAFHVAVGHPPANDGFLNATSISSLPFADSADLTSARSEYGEPTPYCGTVSGGATVWYRYQTNADTLVVLDTSGSDFPSFVAVWTETIFGLGPITCGSSPDVGQGARAAFRPQPGRVYYIQVGRFPYDGGGTFDGYSLEFSAEATPPLPNDDFAGAQPVTSLPFHGQVEALTLSLEPGEPVSSCSFYDPAISSVWYKYTPTADAILRADGEGGYYNAYVAVYTGTSISDLTEVGCSTSTYPFPQLAVEASAGQTYYIQAGQTQFFFGGGLETGPGVSGLPVPGDPTRVFLNLSSMPVPLCAAPQFTVQDPTGDQFGQIIFEGDAGFAPGDFYQPDITSVSGGSNGQDFCMTVQFADTIDPANTNSDRSLSGIVQFDTDANRSTGLFPDSDYICPAPAGIRMEAVISLYSSTGVLIPITMFTGGGGGTTSYAVARYGETSITLIVPLSAIGGDTTFDVAVAFGAQYGFSDCAPNGGAIHSPTGETTLPWPPGDVNCNNSAGPIDATLILQFTAGMVDTLECEAVGDVNHDGRLDTVDASLLLQLWAELIPSLPEF
jgi:hypothetical protein